MIKKKINQWFTDPEEKRKQEEKICQVEIEILSSRLRKNYQKLGEFTFNRLKRNQAIEMKSTTVKKTFQEINEIVNEIKKKNKYLEER